MKIAIQSSKLVKPNYNGNIAPGTNDQIRLSVFDKVIDHTHMAVIYAFNSPTPSNTDIEKGLSKVLADYRVWAGRLGEDAEGNSVFLLNDQGVRFIEATVTDTELRDVLSSKPTEEIQSLHPSLDDVEELLQVQLTRFPCGSLVVGFTTNHQVADGHATSNFLLAWGLATRGLAIGPISPHTDRETLFKPRDTPFIQYNHQNIEYISDEQEYLKTMLVSSNKSDRKDTVAHKVTFTSEFISKLRAKASMKVTKPYSRFTTVCAHIWRAITKARGLHTHETTELRISVDGRMRMDPKEVPTEYFGNLVLWAYPRSKVEDLISRPLCYAAELIHNEVKKINNSYFKSFIDFANSDIINKEGCVSLVSIERKHMSPNLDVYSWLQFPFVDLDFGSGSPYYFMPTYVGIEGVLFLLPSLGDGSIEAVVTVFSDDVESVERCYYSLD